jgi:hypothetical protein
MARECFDVLASGVIVNLYFEEYLRNLREGRRQISTGGCNFIAS